MKQILMPPLTISLIITTYNQKERLALVLDSVKNLNTPPIEVLIADDGSRADTKALIEYYAQNFQCPLRHIWQEDNGFRLCEIRNKAIKAASGEYIILVDGDMILESHFVSDHYLLAKKGVFLQGSRILLNERESQLVLDSCDFHKAFERRHFKAWRNEILAYFVYRLFCIRASRLLKNDLIKGVRGCNMSFFKSDWERIGGFDEGFAGWGREDSDFVARFLINGGELHFLKHFGIAYHIYHPQYSRHSLESNHKRYMRVIQTYRDSQKCT